jgi:hypothetical protein
MGHIEYIKSLEWMNKLVIPNWGIVQHSNKTTPSQKYPSSVDDNARAAVLFSELLDVYQDLSSLGTTFNFVVDAFEEGPEGYPANYRSENRKFQGRNEVPDQACDLKDCYGRALYALARLATNKNTPEKIRRTANDLFLKYATKTPEELQWTNSLSLTAIANVEYLKTKENRRTLNILKDINEELKKKIQRILRRKLDRTKQQIHIRRIPKRRSTSHNRKNPTRSRLNQNRTRSNHLPKRKPNRQKRDISPNRKRRMVPKRKQTSKIPTARNRSRRTNRSQHRSIQSHISKILPRMRKKRTQMVPERKQRRRSNSIANRRSTRWNRYKRTSKRKLRRRIRHRIPNRN